MVSNNFEYGLNNSYKIPTFFINAPGILFIFQKGYDSKGTTSFTASLAQIVTS